MTIDEAINYFECRLSYGIQPARIEAFKIALDVLRERREEEKPLTIDELREIGTKPVWVVPSNKKRIGGWFVIYEDFAYTAGCEYGIFDVDYYNTDGEYGWIAYRIQPKKEEENDT